jgi:hypothetical protein
MPRKRKIAIADPHDFDHRADAINYADIGDFIDADTFLTPAELAKRWRTTVDALRKQRERGTGVRFVCLNRRRVVYRKVDVLIHESNRCAHSTPQARLIGLL